MRKRITYMAEQICELSLIYSGRNRSAQIRKWLHWTFGTREIVRLVSRYSIIRLPYFKSASCASPKVTTSAATYYYMGHRVMTEAQKLDGTMEAWQLKVAVNKQLSHQCCLLKGSPVSSMLQDVVFSCLSRIFIIGTLYPIY